jgi:hypothetical protein
LRFSVLRPKSELPPALFTRFYARLIIPLPLWYGKARSIRPQIAPAIRTHEPTLLVMQPGVHAFTHDNDDVGELIEIDVVAIA